MSIAHGFDPDVSPIFEDDDDEHRQHSVHFSSADTPIRYGRISGQLQRTLGTTRICEETSEQFHEFHQECVAESEHEKEESEPEEGEEDEEVISDSNREGDDVCETDEVIPDSTGLLSDTFIVLSAGCCLPIRHHLSKCLIEMGAEVQKTVDHRTTHLVVDRYADEALVGEAMARSPFPPMMVDVKWIQECMDQRQRCEETDFSMRGARYLRKTCRRLSSFQELPDEGDETRWMDMENEDPQDPAELLRQIKELSDRLDALQNYAPIIRFEYHSPDCPTRQRFSVPPASPSPPQKHRIDPVDFRNLLTSISTSTAIKRRRSFTGFHLEHREPDFTTIREYNRDTRETWKPLDERPRGREKNNKKKKKTIVQTAVNDMRKTMAADLTTIRETFHKNAQLTKSRTPKKRKKNKDKKQSKSSEKKKEKPIPHRSDDSDIQSALASLTISSPPSQNVRNAYSFKSVEILDDVSRRRAPLVVTKSAFINRLQIREQDGEDDDFISDVSAFLKDQKKQRKNASVENKTKIGVIFTGFSKDSGIEKELKKTVKRFKLQVVTEIDDPSTLCVVSRHGKRTLLVLKAICMDVPVVRPQWLEESAEDRRLLCCEDYIFDEWRQISNQTHKIFACFSKIWISVECAAPERADLCWMVERCGGKITRKIHHADLIIAPENWEIPEEVEIPECIEICTPLFIIDSVSRSELQEPHKYVIST
uniref:BRCT domain-containing protein n=1 Tax=Caenorhabditis japonica TaxID=281687 RepID=A0A8R1HZ99_CAEJA